jgi:hypothetical protein
VMVGNAHAVNIDVVAAQGHHAEAATRDARSAMATVLSRYRSARRHCPGVKPRRRRMTVHR